MDEFSENNEADDNIILGGQGETKKIMDVFLAMSESDDEVKEIKNDIKDMLIGFCDENETWTPKQLKTGYKFYKQYVKDRGKAVESELERDKIIELISNIE